MPAAVNLGLTWRGCYYHLLASYDDGELSRFGPGAAHLHELLHQAIDEFLALAYWKERKLPVIIVALGTAVALWAGGVVTLDQAFAGLGDRAVVFIACLFIVSADRKSTRLNSSH